MKFPEVVDQSKIGTHPAEAKAGGGYVWDEVLEYRVWCSPRAGATDEEDGNDYYFVFGNYEEALEFSQATFGADEPLALVLQEEYIAEEEPGQYKHVWERRVTEWPVEFLSRPKRSSSTIPEFLSPEAPANRKDIIRGLVSR